VRFLPVAMAITLSLLAAGCADLLGRGIQNDIEARQLSAQQKRNWDERQAECQRVSGRPCEAPEATALRLERQAAAARGAQRAARLDRPAISHGVGLVQANVFACGTRWPVKGTIEVSVKVSADGRVSSANVTLAPDPALGECVASAIRRATFAKTRGGGSFTQPVVF